MSIYRYARENQTPAAREAAKWQRKVDEVQQTLDMYASIEAEGRKLSDYDAMKRRQLQNRMARFMEENPNDPA